jgi:hypothetical protein
MIMNDSALTFVASQHASAADMDPQDIAAVANRVVRSRRYVVRYDSNTGTAGVLDTRTDKFVGHSSTERGAKALRTKIERNS